MKTILLNVLVLTQFSSYAFLTSHKTAGWEYPENSLEGFVYSLELEVDAIEFDVHFTKDRKMVLSHDPVLDTYNCFKEGDHRKVIIAQTLLKDVQAINCYNKKVKQYFQVPTLDSVLQAYIDSGRTDIELNFEIKVLDRLIEVWERYEGMDHDSLHPPIEEMKEMAMAKIREFGISSNVLFTTFSRDLLLMLKADQRAGEDFRYGLLFKGNYAPLLWPVVKAMGRECFDSCWYPNYKNTYQWLVKHKIDAFLPNWEQLTHPVYKRSFKKHFQKDEKRPFEIYPWTLNTEEQWSVADTYQFDGIVTDVPSTLIER